MAQGSRCRLLHRHWLQYAGHEMEPLRRSRRGSITPVTKWRLYADHAMDPICRSVTGVLSCRSHAAWAWANGGSIGMYVGNVRYNKSRCFETFPFPNEDTGLTPELRQHIATLAEQIDAHRKHQQAAHTGLTLTGMYNVLEALREGRALTAKEKAIHTQGLVSVLKDLHDELDAAVL